MALTLGKTLQEIEDMPERHLDEFRLYYSKQAAPPAPQPGDAADVEREVMSMFPQTKVIR